MNENVQRALDGLNKRKFIARYFETSEEAKQAVLELVGDGTVGMGGSTTAMQMGMYDALVAHGNRVYSHTYNPDEPDVFKNAQYADYFVAGANAVTEDGCIVNMDGMGNRVSSLVFGPKHTVILAGVNKLVPDVAAGYARIKGYVAGMNARRLKRPTPCSIDLKCHNCRPPVRLCRSFYVAEGAPMASEGMYIFLIGEELGF